MDPAHDLVEPEFKGISAPSWPQQTDAEPDFSQYHRVHGDVLLVRSQPPDYAGSGVWLRGFRKDVRVNEVSDRAAPRIQDHRGPPSTRMEQGRTNPSRGRPATGLPTPGSSAPRCARGDRPLARAAQFRTPRREPRRRADEARPEGRTVLWLRLQSSWVVRYETYRCPQPQVGQAEPARPASPAVPRLARHRAMHPKAPWDPRA